MCMLIGSQLRNQQKTSAKIDLRSIEITSVSVKAGNKVSNNDNAKNSSVKPSGTLMTPAKSF